jgi:hypothetical protein
MEAEEVEYGPWKRGDSFDSGSKFVLTDRSFSDWSIVIDSRWEGFYRRWPIPNCSA